MAVQIPGYYTSLPPFAKLFATGQPVLMYHKLGPRPPKVRLKGLYVGAKLFDRQLAELRRAGFVTGAYGPPAAPTGNPGRWIGLTFDDGFVNVLRHGLEPLARHGFKAMQFLVADLLGRANEWELREGEQKEMLMDEAQIREWLAAGHDIGAHTLSHPRLTQISRDQAREEIFASKKKLEDRFGRAIRHFCYPYGDWNPAVRDLVMAAGYETAWTTNPGVNTTANHPFELRRNMARYRSLNLKTVREDLARWAGRVGGRGGE